MKFKAFKPGNDRYDFVTYTDTAINFIMHRVGSVQDKLNLVQNFLDLKIVQGMK